VENSRRKRNQRGFPYEQYPPGQTESKWNGAPEPCIKIQGRRLLKLIEMYLINGVEVTGSRVQLVLKSLRKDLLMSYSNLERALRLARQCEYYTIAGGKSDEVIHNAAELFGQDFSKQNRCFFHEVGYLSFFGNEFYGICADDFSGDYTGGAIEATLADRKDYNLPKDWLTIYFFDDGYMGYLDYSQLNADGEPPVIMAIYNGEEYVVAEKVAEDLGDFILRLVEEQLSDQQQN